MQSVRVRSRACLEPSFLNWPISANHNTVRKSVSGYEDRGRHEETESRPRSCPHHCTPRKKSGHQESADAFALYGVGAKRDIVGLIGVSGGARQSYVVC
jgi:hypothetical protein